MAVACLAKICGLLILDIIFAIKENVASPPTTIYCSEVSGKGI